MRYYLYISDAKVDMLLPQVPGALKKRVAAKLGFDLKVLSGSIETERNTLDTRVARVQVVESYIRETESLGSPSHVSSWISGEEWAAAAEIGEGAILFVSQDTGSILALGGSARHLIGGADTTNVGVPYSFLYRLLRQFKEVVEKEPEYLHNLSEENTAHFLGSGVDQGFSAWVSVIKWVADRLDAPSQRIEFLAKRLVSQTSQKQRITLATPLYVALMS